MFDGLTLVELYALHSQLCADVNAVTDQMLDGDAPRISVFSDRWNLLSAKQAELWETAESAMTEITRRELEVITDA